VLKRVKGRGERRIFVPRFVIPSMKKEPRRFEEFRTGFVHFYAFLVVRPHGENEKASEQ
jgi:hypothetical protein